MTPCAALVARSFCCRCCGCAPRARGAARRDAEGPGARSARARICRRSCAAWSARTSRSTIPTRRSRTICACWCASGSRPATATTQVLDFLVARYGEFVLLKPRFGWIRAVVARARRRVAGRRLRPRGFAPAAARNRRQWPTRSSRSSQQPRAGALPNCSATAKAPQGGCHKSLNIRVNFKFRKLPKINVAATPR